MEPSRRAQARAGLRAYFAIVLVGSAVCEGAIIATGRPIDESVTLVMCLMWTPGIAGALVRIARHEGFADVSLRLGGGRGLRMLALGWLAPLVVGLIAYPLAWWLSDERFEPAGMASIGMEHSAPAIKLAVSIAINLTLGTALSALSAAGEELGWRGYMVPRLVEAGVSRPVLLSGVIWASWHAPLILSGQYAAGPSPLLSTLLFAIGIIAASFVYAHLRLRSGSVWPAIAIHSSWNALIQGTFDVFTKGGGVAHTTNILTGESGILVVGATVLLAWVLTRFREPNAA